MGVNKSRPHVFVLPEDDANRQLALGFILGVPEQHSRQIQLLPVAGGWMRVIDSFLSDHVVDMERWPDRYMVLLIDFDREEQRLTAATKRIPEGLRERVFIVGVWSEPEYLGPGPKEATGTELAQDCRQGTSVWWNHDLLKHNASELARLRVCVRPILFSPLPSH